MYRLSPQASTGVSPAELMFGRKLKIKILELREIRNLEVFRNRDAWRKFKSKERYDFQNKTKKSELKLDDTVLLKAIKRDKLSPEYESVKYKVTDRSGNNVTIKDADGKRNVAHVKKCSHRKPSESDEDVEIISESQDDCYR